MKNLLLIACGVFLLTSCKKENNDIEPFANQNIILGVAEGNAHLFKTIDLNTNKIDSFYCPNKSILGLGDGITYTIDKEDSLYICIYGSAVYSINFITKVLKDSFILNIQVSKIFYSDNSKKIYGITVNAIDSTINLISIDLKLRTFNTINSKVKVSGSNSFSDIEFYSAFNPTTDEMYLVKNDSFLIINPINGNIKKLINLTCSWFQGIVYNQNNGLIYGISMNKSGSMQLTKVNPRNSNIQYNVLSSDIRAYSGKCACITSDGKYAFRRAEDYISLDIVSDNGQILKEIPTDIYCIVSY